jgi:hypothetical protein
VSAASDGEKLRPRRKLFDGWVKARLFYTGSEACEVLAEALGEHLRSRAGAGAADLSSASLRALISSVTGMK